jgi:peptide/nickel transport system ATP-binding protein
VSGHADSVLSARGLGVAYGAHAALADLDLDLARGETLAVVGESGSGKSTLARALLGLLPPSADDVRGTVRLDGREFAAGAERAWAGVRGSRLGYVPQDTQAAFDPLIPVGAQVAEVLEAHGTAREAARARVRELFLEVGLARADHLVHALPERLSGGERQRAAIAAALALDPAVLIADEPTSALDGVNARGLIDLLDRLRRARGLALLWISHDLRAVAARADRVLVLAAGRVVESGDVLEVFVRPAHAATRGLLAGLPRASAPAPRPGATGAGRAAGLGRASGARDAGNGDDGDGHGRAVLSVRELASEQGRGGSFERARAFGLSGISFELRRGEITVLLGESGSGKSTLLRALLALEHGARGSALLEAPAVSAGAATDLLAVRGRALAEGRGRIGWIPQEPGAALDPRATLVESVAEPALARGVPAAEARARAIAVLAACGLSRELAGRLPHELSGGERQRGNLARAFAQGPSVLLLDEPTSNLDPPVAARIAELVRELVAEHALAALWVTHDVALARSLASRALVLEGGRIVESGAAGEVLRAPRSEAGRRLVDAVFP